MLKNVIIGITLWYVKTGEKIVLKHGMNRNI